MHLCIFSVCGVVLMATVCLCQRYAERNPLPLQTLPAENSFYDDYYTDGYEFEENTHIYRWNVDKYPQPQQFPRYCNRMKPSYVCDPDQVLTTEEADKLDKSIQQLYEETPCICEQCSGKSGGIVVGIALMKYIFQPYNQLSSKTIRAFAASLRKSWKLGECDNDILIVVATGDRLSCTDVGQLTSRYVSVDEAHRVFLENKAHFSAGHFYEGLRAMLTDYHDRTRTMASFVKEDRDGLNLGLVLGSIVGAVLLLGIVLFAAVLVYRHRKMRKNPEKAVDEPDNDKPEGVSSGWTRHSFKGMFSSLKSRDNNKPDPSSAAQYQPCDTEEKIDDPEFKIDEEEVIDTTLAVPVTPDVTLGDTSTTELLDKELTKAVDNIAQTFHPPKKEFNGHQTDL